MCRGESGADFHEHWIPACGHTRLFAAPKALIDGAEVEVMICEGCGHDVRLVQADGGSGLLQLALRVEQGRGSPQPYGNIHGQGFDRLVPHTE